MPDPHYYKFGEKGSGIRAPNAAAIQDFYEIRSRCLRDGELFTDHTFPAIEQSIFYTEARRRNEIKWMRASELTEDAIFISEGASRFDVCQGELGDCWLLAAVANLTLNNKLFHRVVPQDQCFKSDYAGVFHFRFWQYGKWIDIVVDDYLPTVNGRLIFMHSKDTNEFWSALLEKAYAKLHGSYEALKGGTTCEAMEDFTGGLTEMYDLQAADCPPNLFQIMNKAHERSSFMGCSIDALEASQMEAALSNGLIQGHAYSITAVRHIQLRTSRVQGKIPLIRVRNPWGNEAEWKGAWSDSSREWSLISDEEKQECYLNFEDDGEFWMSFQDFKKNFSKLEICNLTPEPLDEGEDAGTRYEAVQFEGSWVSGVTAGGCRNNIKSFAINPQYLVTLVDHDEEDEDDLCTLMVALMQKNHRSKRKMGLDSLTIGFAVYELKDDQFEADKPAGSAGFQKQLLTTEYFKFNASVARSPNFINTREVAARFRLKPGQYCIVPSTFDANEEGEFMLRIFTEKPAVDVEENDDEVTAEDPEEEKEADEKADAEEAQETNKQAGVGSFFAKIAGDDMEVDSHELQQILNHALKKEFKFDGFTLDSCRSMVALLDEDRSGKLGLDEFTILWQKVRRWCGIFIKHDADSSSTISAMELRDAFQEAGLTVNRHILQCLVLRYGMMTGGKRGDVHVERALTFDCFVHCCIKLKCCIDAWHLQAKESPAGAAPSSYLSPPRLGFRRGSHRGDEDPKAGFSLNQWVEKVMYC